VLGSGGERGEREAASELALRNAQVLLQPGQLILEPRERGQDCSELVGRDRLSFVHAKRQAAVVTS
jgi:hypothetical protein